MEKIQPYLIELEQHEAVKTLHFFTPTGDFDTPTFKF